MNELPLKNISKNISSGLTPLRSNENFWNSNDIPWVKTEQLGEKYIYDSNEKISRQALKETGLKINPVNTLTIAMYGEGKTRGSVSILKQEMTTNQACCNIVIDERKANFEYVYYFLKTQYHQLRSLSSGVRKNLNSNDIKNFEIRIPKDISTQTRIAKVLSDLDAKIELNNKINAELEAMAKLIYDYWFVQFEFPCLPQDYRPSGQVNPNFDLNEKIRSFCTYKQTGGLPLPDGKTWFVYVLLCDDGSFYKGMTNDLYRRYYEHGTGQGAHHTKVHKPVKVIHWEQFDTQEEAALREKELKTGFGRTWLQREYEKLQKQQEKPGSPAHQNARPSKLIPAGKMVWNEELKREVPEGWECKKLSEFAQTGSGGTPLKSKQEYYENGEIPWINSGEVNMPFITKAEKFITEKGLNNSSAKIFPKGTILMAMYGATAGKVSLMDIEASTNQAICGINPKKDYYSIFLKFGLEDLYEYLINLSSGSARDNLSQEKIKELKFTFPSDDILKSYHDKTNPLLVKILNNMKQNQKLAELRDWLLPMLMNGQVKVGEREKTLGMAAEPQAKHSK